VVISYLFGTPVSLARKMTAEKEAAKARTDPNKKVF